MPSAGPIVSHAVNAAIAYADAVSARRTGQVNKSDHAMIVRHLKDTLGGGLPQPQERFLRRILGEKDEAQYGATRIRETDARRAVEGLRGFVAWAEEQLR